MKQVQVAPRNTAFDLLRICAAVMVVMLHVSALNWYSVPVDSMEWSALNIYDCLVRSAVPLFFMLSGAFVLAKDIPIKVLYLKKIIPLGITFFTWSLLYVVSTVGLRASMSVGLLGLLKSSITHSHYHLWFLPTLMGIYMLYPLLRALAGYKDGTYVKYFVILFLTVGILRPTITLFVTGETVQALSDKVPVELMRYSGYVITGYYLANINKRKANPYVLLACFFGTVATAAAICQLDAAHTGAPSEILYDYFALTSYLEAVFLFLFFRNMRINRSQTAQTILSKLANLTFGVYLLHPFIIAQLDMRFGFNAVSWNPFLAVPVNTLLIALICGTITAIMVKVPIIRRLWSF